MKHFVKFYYTTIKTLLNRPTVLSYSNNPVRAVPTKFEKRVYEFHIHNTRFRIILIGCLEKKVSKATTW